MRVPSLLLIAALGVAFGGEIRFLSLPASLKVPTSGEAVNGADARLLNEYLMGLTTELPSALGDAKSDLLNRPEALALLLTSKPLKAKALAAIALEDEARSDFVTESEQGGLNVVRMDEGAAPVADGKPDLVIRTVNTQGDLDSVLAQLLGIYGPERVVVELVDLPPVRAKRDVGAATTAAPSGEEEEASDAPTEAPSTQTPAPKPRPTPSPPVLTFPPHLSLLLSFSARDERSSFEATGNNVYNFSSGDYPVAFHILLFTSLVIGLSVLFIACGMWEMDPGKDSIIYRMTTQRAKKD